jgi:hypothetical protein
MPAERCGGLCALSRVHITIAEYRVIHLHENAFVARIIATMHDAVRTIPDLAP